MGQKEVLSVVGPGGCPEGEPGVPGGVPSPSSLGSLVTLQGLHLPCTKYL